MRMHLRLVTALVAATLATAPLADDRLKPFVLASRAPSDLAAAAAATKAKLAAAGFEVAGTYAPYESAVVLACAPGDIEAALRKVAGR